MAVASSVVSVDTKVAEVAAALNGTGEEDIAIFDVV